MTATTSPGCTESEMSRSTSLSPKLFLIFSSRKTVFSMFIRKTFPECKCPRVSERKNLRPSAYLPKPSLVKRAKPLLYLSLSASCPSRVSRSVSYLAPLRNTSRITRGPPLPRRPKRTNRFVAPVVQNVSEGFPGEYDWRESLRKRIANTRRRLGAPSVPPGEPAASACSAVRQNGGT